MLSLRSLAARVAAAPGGRAARAALCSLLVVAATGCADRSDADPPGSPSQAILRLERATFAKALRGDSAGIDAAAVQPWQARSLPDVWRSHGEGEAGVGWYRIDFDLDSVAPGAWAIYLAFAQSSFELRLNGTTIAAAPDIDALTLEPRSSQPHLVELPPGALRPGPNRLDIRLRVEQDLDGGLSAVEIGPRQRVEERYLADRFWRSDLPRALDFTLLVAAAFMLLLWVRRRSETIYPWFAALCVVWAVRGFYVAGDGAWLRVLHGSVSQATHDLFLGSSLLVGCALLLIVVNRFAGRPQPRLEYPALVFGLLATAFEGALGRLVSELLNPIWYVVAALLAAMAVRTVASMTWRERNAGNTFIAFGLAFMLATAIHDVLVTNLLIGYTPTQWLVYGPPALLATVVVALGGRYFQAFDEAGRLNRELERRVAERTHDIERQYERISALERHQAVADERERLMRDMHDGIGSQLMTTLHALERGSLPAEQVGELLRICIEDLRLVIDSLDVGEHSLATALANMRYRLEPRLAASGLALDWQVDADAGSWLTPEAVLHVLRVVQEALTNAMKHSNPTRLAVRVQEATELGVLEVEVSDDGDGLASALHRRSGAEGRGLANMRLRAQSLGGDLSTSELSPGTRVRLRLPTPPPIRDSVSLLR